ncbi:protein-L-isoaspartate O-methyltransferase [Qipengyuania sp.]|uniref:protein-L-isoaspartate O-methyltransferase family protein n=1 Tax=Qipengyuania sp. TaxID=2004515 RepID=UPI0035127F9C
MTLTTTRPDFAAARKAMIDSQLRTSGVNDAFVLERMSAVAREDFVPESARATAYMDRAIRLEDGGFLPAPVFHGAMLAEARPTVEDRTLVVDAGSGYLPALVEPLVGKLDTIAPDKAANGSKRGDYTLVLVDGAIEHVPPALAKLVAEGGRIVTGMVDRDVTRLATGRKSGKALALLPLAEMGIPRLGAFDRPQSWSF